MPPHSGCRYMAGGRPAYLPRLKTDLHIHLIDTVSRSTLTQTFVHPHKDEPVDGVEYVFPLAGGVSVVAFTCILADRTINGVVKERERARSDYLEAKSKGKTAGLIQQSLSASDVWTASIGNVPAGETITVKIIYLSELKHDAEINGVRLTIPTHIAPRYGNQGGVEGTGSAIEEEDAEMPPGSSITTVQSPSHPISVNIGKISTDKESQPSLSRASAVLSTPLTGFIEKDCVFEVVATSLGEPVAFLETHASLPNQRALMATLVPKFDLPAEKPEIVFLCDRSGSMKGKIPALVASLNIFLKSLPLGVKFNICSFGSSFDFLWPRSCTYSQDTLSQAVAYVQDFSANYGGTEMYEPIKTVFEQRYKDTSLAVFLLTDGKIWDQQRLFDLINNEVGKPDANARIFTLGVGSGASTSLIEGVAQAGKGFAQAVLKSEKMDKKVIRMLKAALLPQISNYSLEITYQDTSALPEDDFVVIEKNMESLNRTAAEEEEKATPVISLYNKGLESEEDSSGDDGGPAAVDAKYDHLPPVDVPACIQTPTEIPPLYPFNRTTIYVLLPASCPERKPKSILLKATCSHGPLEVEIPIVHLPEPSTTIHQLAARREMKELEEGRGWLAKAKNAEGELLRTKHDGRFSDMVEREAVRIGTRFQVAGKWTSFIAVDELPDGSEQSVADEGFSQSQHAEPAQISTMPLYALSHSKKKKAVMSCCFVADNDYGHGNREDKTDDDPAELEVMKMAGRPLRRNVNTQQHMIDRITQKSDVVDDAGKMNGERLDRIGDGPVSREQKTHSPTPLQTLVSLQQFSGNWAWSQELKTVLRFDIKGPAEAALLKSVDNHTDAEMIIATASAVTFLKRRFAEDKELWDMLADKAETWLRGKVGENVEELFKVVEKAMGF
ncbi:unnamed protein product [Clonostachys rhizophaga]|uniref:von Willebrand factor A domain-containing protein 5A n=1 Tax=Clonostachys rhizophaga TaxID=160324 RepID=A0A9N9W475_9HYPO|nr:unnamed protein product [Clonostachys rhizophaga]